MKYTVYESGQFKIRKEIERLEKTWGLGDIEL